MPIRMLRDWTDSEPVNELDHLGEIVFLRLIMKADDYGRFSANVKLIRSLCFPLKDGVRESDISRQLAACEKAGLIALYQADGKPYLEIVNLCQRLKKSRAKYPPNPSVRQVPATSRDFPEVPGSSGLNGTRMEPELETESEQEPEGARGGVVKFALWEGATAEDLKTPAGMQRAFECVRDQDLCTNEDRQYVFCLLLSIRSDGKVRNLARAFEGAIRGRCQSPWKSRGGEFDSQAKELMRTLDCPPEMLQRTSDLATGPPGESAREQRKRVLEFEARQKRGEKP